MGSDPHGGTATPTSPVEELGLPQTATDIAALDRTVPRLPIPEVHVVFRYDEGYGYVPQFECRPCEAPLDFKVEAQCWTCPACGYPMYESQALLLLTYTARQCAQLHNALIDHFHPETIRPAVSKPKLGWFRRALAWLFGRR